VTGLRAQARESHVALREGVSNVRLATPRDCTNSSSDGITPRSGVCWMRHAQAVIERSRSRRWPQANRSHTTGVDGRRGYTCVAAGLRALVGRFRAAEWGRGGLGAVCVWSPDLDERGYGWTTKGGGERGHVVGSEVRLLGCYRRRRFVWGLSEMRGGGVYVCA